MSYSSECSFYSAELIKLVEQRPLLWNTYHVSHNNKQLRHQAWDSIAAEIIEGWTDLSDNERFSALSDIKRKWKNIKDKFTRDLRQSKLKGSAQKKRKYADLLQFLNYTMPNKNFFDLGDATKTNETDESISVETDFKNEPPSSSDCDTTDEPILASKNILFVDTTSTDATDDGYLRHYATKHSSGFVSSSSASGKRTIDGVSKSEDDGGDDPDKMFLLSMLPMFKNLNERDKIVARIQMTQVLQKLLYPKHGM